MCERLLTVHTHTQAHHKKRHPLTHPRGEGAAANGPSALYNLAEWLNESKVHRTTKVPGLGLVCVRTP